MSIYQKRNPEMVALLRNDFLGRTEPARTVISNASTSIPPTDGELNAAFAAPANLPEGFIGLLDNGGPGGADVWLVMVVNGTWFRQQLGASGGGSSHDPVTLDANANTILSISTQQLGLDTQTANTVWSGPTSGGAAVPSFRALVSDDIPTHNIITKHTITGAAFSLVGATALNTLGLLTPSANPGAAEAVLKSAATTGYLQLTGLGIGTAAASTRLLSVSSATAWQARFIGSFASGGYGSGIIIENTGSGTRSWGLMTRAGGDFVIKDATFLEYEPFIIEPDAPTNLLYLDSTGRVGINKSNPDAKLHIVNTGDIGWSTLGNAHILMGTTTAGLGLDTNEIATTGGDLYIGTIDATYSIIFRAGSSTKRMHIDGTTGYVGIGNITPSYNLDVSGLARIVGGSGIPLLITSTNASSQDALNVTVDTGDYFKIRHVVSGADHFVRLQMGYNSTDAVYLDAKAGNASYINNPFYVNTSSSLISGAEFQVSGNAVMVDTVDVYNSGLVSGNAPIRLIATATTYGSVGSPLTTSYLHFGSATLQMVHPEGKLQVGDVWDAANSITLQADSGAGTIAYITSGTAFTDSLRLTASGAGADIYLLPQSGLVGVNQATAAYNLDVNGTFNAGAGTLTSLTVNGNVDVLSGGDLTVGANVLFVNVSLNNVGVMGVADPQFALDVFGPMRAELFIGPHAIQLDEAIMICHFDGKRPYENDFTGEYTGHFGQVATVNGGPIFRPGKFQKGLQLAGAASNLVPNSSFESALITDGGWQTRATNTIAKTLNRYYYGDYCCQVTVGTPSDGLMVWDGGSVVIPASSETYVMTAWIWVPSNWDGGDIRVREVNFTGNTGRTYVQIWTAGVSPTEEWYKLETYVTLDGTDTAGAILVETTVIPTAGRELYVDALQFEVGPEPSPYLDGSMGTGHSFAGTAHNSVSSRTAAYITYDIEMEERTSYSIGLWMNALRYAAADGHIWFDWYKDGDVSNNRILIYHLPAGANGIRMYNIANAVSDFTDVQIPADNTWYHLVYTLNHTNGEAKCYVNGALIATDTWGTHNSFPDKLRFGTGNASYPSNSLVDDFFLTGDVLTDDEVRAIYESDAPVFAESSIWSFRTQSGATAVWADEEGLWGRTSDGTPMIGVSAVDSKSWGGKTLDAGDALFGSSNAVMWWDKSAAQLLLGNTTDEHISLTGSDIIFYNGVTERAKLAADIWTLGNTSTEHVEITTSALSFKQGATTRASLTGGTWTLGATADEHITITATALNFNDGASTLAQLTGGSWTLGSVSTQNVQITSTAINLRNATTNWASLTTTAFTMGLVSDENIYITNAAIQFRDATTVYGEITGTQWTIGNTTQDHVIIASTGISLKDSSTIKMLLETDGDFFLGTNVGVPGTFPASTYLSIFATNQTYNTESMLAGEMLIGNNSASKANIKWDVTNGRLLFRGGQTMASYISTDGSIIAGAGDVTINASGIGIGIATSVFLGGSKNINFYASGTTNLVSYLTAWRNPGVPGYNELILGATSPVTFSTTDNPTLTIYNRGDEKKIFMNNIDDGLEMDGPFIREGYASYAIHPLTTNLTHADWDGDAKTTADNGYINFPSLFTTPTAAKALFLRITIKATAAGTLWMRLGPSAGNTTIEIICPIANQYSRDNVMVPCNVTTNPGQIYATFNSTGLSEVFIEVTGWAV